MLNMCGKLIEHDGINEWYCSSTKLIFILMLVNSKLKYYLIIINYFLHICFNTRIYVYYKYRHKYEHFYENVMRLYVLNIYGV